MTGPVGVNWPLCIAQVFVVHYNFKKTILDIFFIYSEILIHRTEAVTDLLHLDIGKFVEGLEAYFSLGSCILNVAQVGEGEGEVADAPEIEWVLCSTGACF